MTGIEVRYHVRIANRWGQFDHAADKKMTSDLIVERRETTTTLRLNRPQRANSLNARLVAELHEAISAACGDGTRTLILRGEGKTFCSGFDLHGIERQSDAEVARRIVDVEAMLQALHHAPMLTVALVHGKAIGAGADLMCACRWRICAADSRFCMPGLNFGIFLGNRRLAQKIGADNAQRMLIDARVLDAGEAARIGLVTQIAQPHEWTRLIESAAAAGSAIDADYVSAMLEMTTPDSREQDMADLKNSVREPGLVKRIVAYRDVMRSRAGKMD